LVVWRFLDGKAGHENQSLGLVKALGEETALQIHDIEVPASWRAWLGLLTGRCPAGATLPAPDLLIGAGHGTHVALLACRRARGGRAVVLMRPSLPVAWFDLCIVPEHDRVQATGNVFRTQGVLNAVRPSHSQDPDFGLVLVGGPSSHHGWDEARLCNCVRQVVEDGDRRHWTVATSRRTPASTVAALQTLVDSRVKVVPSAQTAAGWLATQMRRASVAWITEDSVSMLYEALTAGAACGVLPVPVRRPGRVTEGVRRLLSAQVVVSFDDWRGGQALRPAAQPFDEAARCARWMVSQWLAS
jgi:mitochondrial fission protein ELM1